MQEQYNATVFNDGENGSPTTILLTNQTGQDLDRDGINFFRRRLCVDCPLYGNGDDCGIRAGSQIVSPDYTPDQIKKDGVCAKSLVFSKEDSVIDTQRSVEQKKMTKMKYFFYALGGVSAVGLLTGNFLMSRLSPFDVNMKDILLLAGASLSVLFLRQGLLINYAHRQAEKLILEGKKEEISKEIVINKLAIINQNILAIASFVLAGGLILSTIK